MSVDAGTRIGPYKVLSVIGAGGMGEVYRAHDMNLGRDVALKMLPDTLANDAERITRFEREAHTLAKLNHPNIAHVYGFERSAPRSEGRIELWLRIEFGRCRRFAHAQSDEHVKRSIRDDQALPYMRGRPLAPALRSNRRATRSFCVIDR